MVISNLDGINCTSKRQTCVARKKREKMRKRKSWLIVKRVIFITNKNTELSPSDRRKAIRIWRKQSSIIETILVLIPNTDSIACRSADPKRLPRLGTKKKCFFSFSLSRQLPYIIDGYPYFSFFSRVLRNSTPRFVGPSVGLSVGPSVTLYLFKFFMVFGLTDPAPVIKWPQIRPLSTRTRLG